MAGPVTSGRWRWMVLMLMATTATVSGQVIPTATCTAWGDPHFTTFDGTKYEFQGLCTYTMAKDCGSDSIGFSVEVQLVQANVLYPPVSTVDKVYVAAYGYGIEIIDEDRVVRFTYPPPVIGTFSRTPPFNLAEGKIQVTLIGKYIAVRLTELYVEILYNLEHRVMVTVPSTYQNKMCGLCGNYNNMGTDDLVMPNGNIASNVNEFGNSWEIDGIVCPDDRPTGEPPTQGPCAPNYSDPCNVLTDTNGTFASCHGVVDPQVHFESCVFETCAKAGQGLCANLEAYYDSCTEAGVPSFTWRTSELCPMDCPANSTYSTCAPLCPPACVKLNPCFSVRCFEGCKCDPGYLQSGLNCVLPADCGCTSNDGFYYPLGTTWKDGDEQCVCHAGNMTVCEALECPANSTYSTCTSACPATCANHIPGNCEECYEGCGCDPGYLKSGPNITNINCVLPADCGCTSNGLYHPLGSVWLEGDELCVCHAGNRTVCIVTSESGAVGASVGVARIMVWLFVAIFLVTEWH